MAQLIDKDSLVEKINDWRDKIEKGIFLIPLKGKERADAIFDKVLGKVISLINNLEVKDVPLV